LEITAWKISRNEISAKIDLQRVGSGEVWLQIPGTVGEVTFEGEKVTWTWVSENVLQVSLRGIREGKLVVIWE
jgi:hypothetical protein